MRVTIEFDDILQPLHDALTELRGELMASIEQMQAALAEIDAETTRIGAKIEELLDRLNDESLTAEQEEVVLDGLRTAAQRLKGIASAPDNPVPDPIEGGGQ